MSIPLLFYKRAFHPRQLFSALQGAWLEPTLGYIFTDTAGTSAITAGGQAIARINDQSGYGYNASQSTAANRPTYQLNSGLPLARHDATDSMSVSLPAINVRRNLLTWSESFDNAAWTKRGTASVIPNATLAPNGTGTADLVSGIGTTSSNDLYLSSISISLGDPISPSIYIKRVSVAGVLRISNSASSVNGLWTINLSMLSDGWERITALHPAVTIVNSFTGGLGAANGLLFAATSGAPLSFYIWGAQLELGSVATDYQRITDWTSEAYSSNGSVYFATPVGMSALHNQSMGTTYTLPALSSDIYSWIVVPQRLSTAQENRLARYMERKAGIAGPDYLLDNSDNQLTADDGTEFLLRA